MNKPSPLSLNAILDEFQSSESSPVEWGGIASSNNVQERTIDEALNVNKSIDRLELLLEQVLNETKDGNFYQ